jgi:hypothetical protein
MLEAVKYAIGVRIKKGYVRMRQILKEKKTPIFGIATAKC